MKKFLVFSLFCVILLSPIKTKAVYEVEDPRCTKDIKISLREDGQLVTYRLTKVVSKENVTYTLILYNVTENMYVTDKDGNKINATKIENLKPGTSFSLSIYASDKSHCGGYKIASKIINVPYYNKYSTNELCNGYETYYLCKEDSNVNMTEKEFESNMKKYIESLNKKDDKEEEKNEDNSFNILDFLNEYKYFFIGGIALIITVVLIIVISNKRKNKGIL